MIENDQSRPFLDAGEIVTVGVLFFGSIAGNLMLWMVWGRKMPALALLILVPLLISAVLIVGGRRQGRSKRRKQ